MSEKPIIVKPRTSYKLDKQKEHLLEEVFDITSAGGLSKAESAEALLRQIVAEFPIEDIEKCVSNYLGPVVDKGGYGGHLIFNK